ncbi:hypothetical protein L3Q82_017036 [Scortum barcoo]|uniref:Uncharacterized protein n=1 Tax=Scortum barcoo TaxID=214431 RepID=A0ACB8X9D7_9TELE|nr:hypothetical protein L3Q82_017036 [Scortum barcoo]
MDRLVRRASSVLGCPLDSVEVVGNGRMMAKLSSLLTNTSHPLQDSLTALGSSFSELAAPSTLCEGEVPAEESDRMSKLTSVFLGGLSAFLAFLIMVIIGLVVKNRKIQSDWISASVSEPETVEVQPGGEVTLLCSNLTNTESTTFWFRLVQGTKISCISTMMKSNRRLRRIHHTWVKTSSVFLGDLCAFLVMVIIGLVVKNRKLQSGWISVSVCETQTVNGQLGKDVTLGCPMMGIRNPVIWFKVVNRSEASWISTLFGSSTIYSDRVQSGKI